MIVAEVRCCMKMLLRTVQCMDRVERGASVQGLHASTEPWSHGRMPLHRERPKVRHEAVEGQMSWRGLPNLATKQLPLRVWTAVGLGFKV